VEAKQEPTRKNKQAGELITFKGRLSPDNSAVQHKKPHCSLVCFRLQCLKKEKENVTQVCPHI
jgi:hypothetical protein